MFPNPGIGALLALLVPVVVAAALLASQVLTAPSLAERRRRARNPSRRWDRLEIVAGIIITLAVAALIVLALVDLWIHRNPY